MYQEELVHTYDMGFSSNTRTNPSLGPVPWGTNPNYITNNIIDTLAARNDTIWIGCNE